MVKGVCPVCNGFTRLHVPCPVCRSELDDGGRLSDYYGDYSPYRPIDDAKLSNGFPDLCQHQCIHLLFCPHCGEKELFAIQETFQ